MDLNKNTSKIRGRRGRDVDWQRQDPGGGKEMLHMRVMIKVLTLGVLGVWATNVHPRSP